MTKTNAITVGEAVSQRLSHFRKAHKFSFDELSKRAQISKGMLVEIEKGSANPSIAILCKLAAVMGLSVAELVNVVSDPAVHLVESADIPLLWQGERGGSARLLAGTVGPDMLELWRWQMFPGEMFISAGHPAGTSELLHVEQGTLSLKVAESEFEVAEGCSAIAKTDAPHHYANQTGEVLIFTMTVSEPHQR